MTAPAVDRVLGIEGVAIRYGNRQVLHPVSLDVPRGSVFALLGRNGSGKSSLVRCLLGQQKPAEGRALVFGEDAWRRRQTLMERIGVVPEEPDAPPDLTPRQLESLCASLYRRWDAETVRARLQRLEVPLDTAFGRLSKGQKGAVMLALAFGHAPDLLVLDDPTLGLDVVARRLLYEEIIGDLAERGTTVFLTTHDLAGVERLADRVAILRDRALVLTEELDALRWRCRKVRLSGAGLPAEAAAFAPFEVRQVTARPWGAELFVTNFDEDALRALLARVGAKDAEVGAPSLEDIFLAYAGEVRSAA